jgi:Cu/Ag efflux protein CusF
MKKFVATLAALAMLGFAGAASAEEAKGKIQSVDPTARTVILEDGTTFTVGEGVAIEGLQPGTEVTVMYDVTDGKNTATAITPAQQ